MNLLILSAGRRCEIVEFFRQHFDQVLAVDITEYAPALYYADKYFILAKDLDNPREYMEKVLSICKQEKVDAILTLIDPELVQLDRFRQYFIDAGVTVILSDHPLVDNTYDKYRFYCEYKDKLNLVTTFATREEVIEKHQFDNSAPIIIKPIKGSGSIGINKIHYKNEFETLKFDHTFKYIYQPYIFGQEFGIDLYFDMFTNQIVSFFMKEKIQMRAGETDKAISVFRDDILHEVKKLEQCGKFSGPVDVDVFVANNGSIYINEVNPRFGGGYPMAHACGIDFMKLILENLQGKIHTPLTASYPVGVKMMKHQQIFCLNEKQVKS